MRPGHLGEAGNSLAKGGSFENVHLSEAVASKCNEGLLGKFFSGQMSIPVNSSPCQTVSLLGLF